MHTLTRTTLSALLCGALSATAWAQTAPAVPVRPAAPAAPAAAVAPASPVLAQAFALEAAALAKSHLAIEAEALALARVAAGTMVADQDQSAAEREAQRARELAAREHERAARDASRDRSLYSRGTAALDAGRWSRAVEAFAAAAELKGSRADGALYWKAYSEYKLAQKAAALATLQQLKAAYPESPWLKESRALEVEMSGSAAATEATASDDELKLLAINGLMRAEDERAVPMLEKILTSQQSPQLKKRALFVLSQSKSPKAREAVLGIAKGASNPDLQLEALRYVAMFGGTQNLQVLSDIYTSSKDVDVKRRILEAYMIGGQRELVLNAARSESDSALRAQAVRLLGAMRATAELDKLYQAESSAEVKRAVIEAYMAGGDAERLARVAQTDKDATMRLRAIEMLGALGRGKNTAVMTGLYYADGQSSDAKRAVINGLFISGDAKTLIDIARKETDPALRKSLVERLSLMKSKEATDFLMEIINK
ncbi:MAG: HEAT repeat domain-containing protein [Vicinamibacterales bacterium]|nr:HEAT repeat domain-containing protein [Vicinamibacterales bacterium]